MHSVLWEGLHQKGHDACRFAETADGWAIEGAAVFDHNGQPASLAYRLICDRQWASLHASVTGWIGKRDIRIDIAREGDDGWCVNGTRHPALTGLKDIDLGFTPASNTNAIRRLNLPEGAGVETVAVWLDTEDWAVKPLRQSYRRINEHSFAYASPQHGYHATLTVDEFGAVTDYPDLWVRVGQG